MKYKAHRRTGAREEEEEKIGRRAAGGRALTGSLAASRPELARLIYTFPRESDIGPDERRAGKLITRRRTASPEHASHWPPGGGLRSNRDRRSPISFRPASASPHVRLSRARFAGSPAQR